MPAITITDLQRLAVTYQSDMRYLPYAVLFPVLAEHGITLFPGIQDTHKLIEFQRKQGIAKPYSTSETLENSDVGKVKEHALKVETAYARVLDNIKNYKEVIMVKPNEMIGANKTKKNPFEIQLMMAMVRTFGEDILDALFPAERDATDHSPMGLFDGFETKLLALISAGEVASGKGNYLASGTMDAPSSASDTDAYDNLVTWLKGADPYLLKNSELLMPRAIANNCYQAMKNKTAQKAATFIDFQEYLQDDVDSQSRIRIIPSRYMGTGDRLVLKDPDLFHFGMNSMGDETFVQIMPKDGDPNQFYYWIQGDYGVRVSSTHKKRLFTNDGTLTANRLSGDYS